MRLFPVFALVACLVPGLSVSAEVFAPERHGLGGLAVREATLSTTTATETFSDTTAASVTNHAAAKSNLTTTSNATAPAPTTPASLSTPQASNGKLKLLLNILLDVTVILTCKRWQEFDRPQCPSHPAYSHACTGHRRISSPCHGSSSCTDWNSQFEVIPPHWSGRRSLAYIRSRVQVFLSTAFLTGLGVTVSVVF